MELSLEGTLQLAVSIFFLGACTLLLLEILQWAASGLKPAIGFRGFRRLAAQEMPVKCDLNAADEGLVLSTDACDCRIVSANEVVFTDHKTLFGNPWLLKGRIVSGGTTSVVETYGSVTFWVLMVTLLALWFSVTWAPMWRMVLWPGPWH
jgi:hypothetical protein